MILHNILNAGEYEQALQHANIAAEYNRKENYYRAIEECEQGMKIFPTSVECLYNWGFALLHLGFFDDAILKFKEAIRLHPKFAQAYQRLGDTYYLLNNPNEALKNYQESIKLYPITIKADKPPAPSYTEWGGALCHIANYYNNITYYSADTSNTINKTIKILQFYKDNRATPLYTEAIAKFIHAIELDSSYAPAYYMWGYALSMLNTNQEAIDKFKKAIYLDSSFVMPYIGWAVTLEKQNNENEAFSIFQDMIRKEMDYPYAYLKAGNYLKKRGYYEEANNFYKIGNMLYESGKFNKNIYSFYYNDLAELVLCYSNDFLKCEKLFKTGLKLEPSNTTIMLNLALLYKNHINNNPELKTQLYWRIDSLYETALQLLLPKSKILKDIYLFQELSNLYLVKDDYDRADYYLRQAISITTEDSLKYKKQIPIIYSTLGEVLIRKALYINNDSIFIDAIKNLDISLSFNPSNIDALNNLAFANFKVGKYVEAENIYNKVLKITADDLDALIGLGEVSKYLASNNKENLNYKAIDLFENAIRTCQSNHKSKFLSTRDISNIRYSIGYTKVQLYNQFGLSSEGKKLLKSSLVDFKECVGLNPEHFAAKHAIGIISSLDVGTWSIIWWRTYILPLMLMTIALLILAFSVFKMFFGKFKRIPKLSWYYFILLIALSTGLLISSFYLPQITKLQITPTSINIEKKTASEFKSVERLKIANMPIYTK